MAIQTATNPETGERIALIDGQWQPFSQSATNDKGQKAFLVGNQWITETPTVATQPEAPQRTWGEAAKDVGAGLVSGAGSLIQFPAQLVGLAKGELEPSKGVLGFGKEIEKYGEEMKSESLKRMERQRAEKIQQAVEEGGEFGGFKTALSETVKSPALLTSFLAEQAPQLLAPFGAAKVGVMGAKALGAGAEAAGKIGTRAAIGAGALQQGADIGAGAYEDIYKELKSKGATDAEATEGAINLARSAGASGAVISLLAQRLPGARRLEEALAGVPGKGSRIVGGIKTAAGELPSEVFEETGGKTAQNIAMQQVKPEQKLTAGLGETAAMAGLGAVGMGGVTGALQRRAPAEALKPPAEEAPPPETKPEEAPPVTPAPPAAPPAVEGKKFAPPEPAVMGDWDPNYTEGLPEESGTFFQNRDRSTPASVGQMQSIAANPDYTRLSVSRDLGSGAPVVISDLPISEDQFGRTSYATASDGTRIPVRYAVVNGNDITPSNTADGSRNAEYGDMSITAIRPIAGNGRVAGLRAAYSQGTANNYKQELLEDTEHGIDPNVIGLFENPVLVRVMPKSYVTPNIADISNISGTLRLSPVESAKNDINRIDLSGLTFNDDGSPNTKTLIEFVRAMPKDEQGELIDANGMPNTKAIDRLNNAIFYKAYGSDSLIELYAQAADPEARAVLQALARVAPKMAALEGAGEYDIRQPVLDAAEMAVNARRAGQKLKDYAQQGALGADPNALKVLDMFADNSRSSKKMAEALERLADSANEQAQAPAEDMMGAVPKIPVDDLYKNLAGPAEAAPDLFAPTPQEPKPPKAEPAKPKYPVAESPEFTITKPLEKIAQEIHGKTIPELAQWAVDNAPNDAAKAIAQRVLERINEFSAKGIYPEKVKVLNNTSRWSSGTRAHVQTTSAKGHGLIMTMKFNGLQNGRADERSGTRYHTVLHELIHAATVAQIYHAPKSKSVNDLKVLYNKVMEQLNQDARNGVKNEITEKIRRGANIMKNPAELMAWGLTDYGFQDYLANIKIGETTGFRKLVDIVRQVLGLSKQYESALDALVKTTDEMMETSLAEVEAEMAKTLMPLKPIKVKGRGIVSPEKVETKVEETRAGELVAKGEELAKKALQKRKPMDTGALEDVDPDFVKALGRVFNPQSKTVIDRIDDLKDNFWKKLAQGVADQYRTIKDYDPKAYMMARMSKTVDGGLEGLMFHGHVFNDDGALNIKKGTKGLMEALKPVGAETDRYMMWVALNRDARLSEDKRSIDPRLTARRDELAHGMIDGRNRLDVYKQVQKDMNALNKSVLDIAFQTGLIDKAGYDKFSNDIFYIPFYREMEDGDLQAPQNSTAGLTGQKFSKELKGGQKPFGDLMENTLRNWSHILSAAMKNQAAKASIDAAVNLEAAAPVLKSGYRFENGKVYNMRTNQPVPEVRDANGNVKYKAGEMRPELTRSDIKGAVKVMQDGKVVYYEIDDPMLMEAITSIGYMGPKSRFLDVARDFKNLLQYGVTISPAFKVRNLFRDSISALAVTDLKKNPFANIVDGWSATDKNNPAHISALAGGAIFNFGSVYEGDQAKLIKRLLKQGVKEEHILDTPDKIKAGLMYAWDKYNEWGNKSEAANRMALYNQLRAQGASHLEASFQARDMLDFSMQGAWPAFRWLTQVIPFLNARIQGLYKLGRDGINPTARVIYNTATGKEITASDRIRAQQFSVVAGMTALASLMLYAAFKDDEDFQKRDDWDRDNFWWIKIPGMQHALRIPKPFEIGAFGTIAERTAEQIFDQGSEGKQFADSLTRMLTDTFAVNLPQFIKPMVDLYANKDSFTGAPIESAGMERLSKAERSTDSTSPLAVAVGGILNTVLPEKAEMSPVQVDYAIKAYFGWLGGSAAWLSHYAVMPFQEGTKPDNKWEDTLSLGFVKSLPANQSRYVTAFYENSKQMGQALADMRHYAEIGDSEKVQKLLEDKGDKIALAKFYDKTSKDMSEMRQAIRVIMADKDMPGDQKREEVDRIKQLISMLAQQAEEVRKSMK